MRIIAVFILVAAATSASFAVGTSHWTHTSEADFKAGTFKDVVATNLGDLKLSRAVKNLLGQDPRVSAVYAMAQLPGDDGAIYAATGPEGVLLRIHDDRVDTFAELGDNASLFSLLVDAKGDLLVGTGGEKGRIYRISKDAEPAAVFEADEVQYIWSMVQTTDGKIYAATGPDGQIYEIDGNSGASRLLIDTDENNILCLLSDGGEFLYAGTDPNGLVYRINRKSGELFVVYDAPETEISALARDAVGNIYAATAQATEPMPGEPEIHATEQVGRPEGAPAGVPIPSERPPVPAPPEVPDPSPGEPLPIPRRTNDGTGEVRPQSMMMLAQPGPDGDQPRETPDDSPDESPDKQPDNDPEKDPDSKPGEPAQPEPDLDAAARMQQQPVGAFAGGEPIAEGNAIYCIDRNGFVTEIFRQNVLIYSIIERDGNLLVGTGTEGQIFQIRPAAEETSVLAKVDPKDVLCMLRAEDGRLLLGLANSGEIAVLTPGFASSGTYTSPVLDAGQISRFGKVRLRGTLPAGTALHVSTRSGNVASATDAGWSEWSDEISAAEFVQISSPPARFLQYRLRFSSDTETESPAVEEVDVAYQLPNLAPKITSITVTPGDVSPLTGEANPDTQKYTIGWEAADANEDTLTYRVHFRAGSRAPWILMKDKLSESSYEWETRSVADGTYQVKVEASDERANALGTGRTSSRVSDPILVDNTPPAIGEVRTSIAGRDVRLEMKVVDRTGTVTGASYAVDSSADWQTVLPSDNIADSPEETFRFTIPGLTPGQHQIMLRALDKRGNAAFESVSVTVE